MSFTMRVSLPGYNALTDSNRDHYALYADEDNILIKEFERGTVSINSPAVGTITHDLGYVPMVNAFIYNGTGYSYLYGRSAYNSFQMRADDTNLYIINTSGATREGRYYIFHDEVV